MSRTQFTEILFLTIRLSFNNPDKGAITHAIVHRVLWEYLCAVNDITNQAEQEKHRREVFESCQEILPEMVHTKDGSRAVREFLAQGSAKVPSSRSTSSPC